MATKSKSTRKRSRKQARKHPAITAMRAIVEAVASEPDASSLVRSDFENYDLPAIANGRPFGWIVATTGTHLLRVGQDMASGDKSWVKYHSDRKGITAADVVDTFRSGSRDEPTYPTVRGVYFWDGVGLVSMFGNARPDVPCTAKHAAARLDERLLDAELAGLVSNELAEAARYQAALDKGEYDSDGYWSTRRDEHLANAERIGEERKELMVWK